MRASWISIRGKLAAYFNVSDLTDADKAKHVNNVTGFPRRGLLLEEDISNYGDRNVNCATMLEIDNQGNGKCIGIYNQNPNIDPFCGTNKLEYDQNFLAILDRYRTNLEEVKKIIEYELLKIYRFMHDREFAGIFGVDFFICFSQDAIKILFTEVNARITNNSGINVVVAMNHKSLHHMPLNAHFPEPVNNIDDLSKYCVVDGVDYLRADPTQLSIMPQAFTAIWRKGSSYVLVEPGYVCRLIILGNDHNKISYLTRRLSQKGIVFT